MPSSDGAREAGEIGNILEGLPGTAHGDDAGEGTERHGDVDRHIDEHALDALAGPSRKANQSETHVADRGIRHQPLDVALADGGE